jgi:hypothetical protein
MPWVQPCRGMPRCPAPQPPRRKAARPPGMRRRAEAPWKPPASCCRLFHRTRLQPDLFAFIPDTPWHATIRQARCMQ